MPPFVLWVAALLPLAYYAIRQIPFSAHVSNPSSLQSTAVIPTDVISLTQALVDIRSPSGEEQAAFAYAHSWLNLHNFTTILQPIGPLSPSHASRHNLLGLHPDAHVSDVQILLSTHLDTVPGVVAIPDDAAQRGRLYGRGSVDAKGQAASMMLAVTHVWDPRVAVLLVCGEETDHAGMLHAHELRFVNITLINGEPTESKVAIRQKGMVRAKITSSGRSAHSGYPHLGHSAIHKLLDVLQELRSETVQDDGTTLNIGLLHGGAAANVVADAAEATVMWRVVGKASNVEQKARQIAGKYKDVEFVILKMNDAMDFYTPEKVGLEVGTTQVAYNTDVPYYQGAIRRAVLFGAGSIHQAHTEQEYIETKQLERLPMLYERMARDLLQDEDGDGISEDTSIL